MEIGLLGALLVTHDGAEVDVRGARLRALLARLALDTGRYVSVTTLAASLWEDGELSDEVNALQSLVSRLRRQLPDPALVESHAAGYRLLVDADQVDVQRFASLAHDGRAALAAVQPAEALTALEAALALWRGPALADVSSAPFAATYQLRLSDQRLAAQADLLEVQLALGRADLALPELETLVTEHPLQERLRSLHLRALAATGRPADALAAYESVRRQLADELGADPSPELQAVHAALLRGDATASAPGPTLHPSAQPALALTSFVGREYDLELVAAEVRAHRLVTLVGPGGAGKTRLATETGRRLADEMPGGVWVAPLAPLSEPRDLPAAVASLLGLREVVISTSLGMPPTRDPLDRMVEAFSEAATLLVLDNCEHLVEAAAELADQLLARTANLRVLATSREPLGIVGETLLPIAPLDRPEPGSTVDEALKSSSVQLFADRAAAVSAGFAVDERTVDAVVEICRRLDGLPLALELAAARLRTMGVHQLASRLDDRFKLLTGGSRTALPRHRTLAAVVSWSWDLLTEDERTLAERLAVFPGGITPAAAEAIWGQEPLDLLTALVDKSLLQVVDLDEPRYRMLETIREFGIERLASRGELAAARLAHATYFADLAHDADSMIRSPEQLTAIRLLAAESDNLSAAMRYVIDTSCPRVAMRLIAGLSAYWTMLGRHDEALTWADEALALVGSDSDSGSSAGSDVDPVDHAVLAAVRAITLSMVGDPAQHDNDLEALVEAAGGYGAHPLFPLVLAMVAFVSGSSDAEAQVTRATTETTDPWALATLKLVLALIRQNRGDSQALLETIAEARELFASIGDRWGLSMTSMVSAEILVFADDVPAALREYAAASEVLRELGAHDDLAQSLWRRASLEAALGAHDRAEDLLRELEDVATQSRLSRLQLYVELARGGNALEQGDLETARRWLGAAMVRLQRRDAGVPGQIKAVALIGLAGVAGREGDLDHSRVLLREAYVAATVSFDRPLAALAVASWALLLIEEGEPLDAARALGLATALRGMDDRGPGTATLAHDRALDALGQEAYETAYAAGSASSATEATLLAAALLGIDPPPQPISADCSE